MPFGLICILEDSPKGAFQTGFVAQRRELWFGAIYWNIREKLENFFQMVPTLLELYKKAKISI